MNQFYNHWNRPDPYVCQIPNSPLMDEFSLDGPPENPFAPLSYEEAYNILED